MAKRMTVVISQGQSQHPAKRQLEEDLVSSLLMEAGVDVVVVPHLYDLTADGTGILALQGITGPMIVLSWLYERAARWTLDRNGIRGEEGLTLLKSSDDEEDESEGESAEGQNGNGKQRVAELQPRPPRRIYCLDLRTHASPQPYLEEIRRIVAENRANVVQLGQWIGGQAKPEALQRFIEPTNDTSLPIVQRAPTATPPETAPPETAATTAAAETVQPVRVEEAPQRRWYPVIDYSRCTNCMECIDFCLFGVYGVDRQETILVEQPDNCRKGCPACSRVCPENAIIFPQHKTPAIAGAPVGEAGSLKIDLSKLFGAPEGAQDAFEVAARERDEQLLLAGRDAVGLSVGIPKRQTGKSVQPKDDLDDLLDALDELNL